MMKTKDRQVLDFEKTKLSLWELMYFSVDSYKIKHSH